MAGRTAISSTADDTAHWSQTGITVPVWGIAIATLLPTLAILLLAWQVSAAGSQPALSPLGVQHINQDALSATCLQLCLVRETVFIQNAMLHCELRLLLLLLLQCSAAARSGAASSSPAMPGGCLVPSGSSASG
jgi:hypothetical protein